MHGCGKQSMAAGAVCRGEVVEDVESPLPLSTPLLLVKPPLGLSTPAVFKALDLGACSTADPQQLLSGGPRLLPSSPGSSVALPAVHCGLCGRLCASDAQQLLLVRCKVFVWTAASWECTFVCVPPIIFMTGSMLLHSYATPLPLLLINKISGDFTGFLQG